MSASVFEAAESFAIAGGVTLVFAAVPGGATPDNSFAGAGRFVFPGWGGLGCERMYGKQENKQG
jgi:hypothetical protein